jgi:hypothetical protein
MSLPFVRTKLLQPIRDIIDANLKTRSTVQITKGQILEVSERDLKVFHDKYGITDTVHKDIYKDFVAKANELDQYYKSRDETRHTQLKALTDGYVVNDHKAATDLKNYWAQLVNKATGIEVSTLDGSNNNTGVQIGHGDRGLAVAAWTALRALTHLVHSDRFGGSALGKQQVEAIRFQSVLSVISILEAPVLHVSREITASIETEMYVNKSGDLHKHNIYRLTFEDAKSNQAASIKEGEALKEVRKYLTNRYENAYKFMTEHGGDTLEEAIEGVLFNSLTSKARGVKVTGPKGRSKYSNSHKASEKIVTKTSVKRSKFKTGQVQRQYNKVSSKPSQINIVALLNARLPQEIRSRMTYPRLVNRTGRFSESVQVVSADTTPKGGTSIAYTYQKDPYQLFERGRSRLATPDREPRDIIDASIRSLAQEMMLGRFYTRRV